MGWTSEDELKLQRLCEELAKDYMKEARKHRQEAQRLKILEEKTDKLEQNRYPLDEN